MKIFNDFKLDQHETFYLTQMKNAEKNMPILDLKRNEDNKLVHTVPALAALAFLTTVMDDAPIADFIPDTISTTTFQSGMEASQQQMLDYFSQVAKGAEAGDLLDFALASVALPTIYSKAIDTFSEPQKSGSKKEENRFNKLVPKVPLNMTKDVSKDVKSFLGDDHMKPPNGFPLPLPAKVQAFYPNFIGGKAKTIRANGDSNFAGDNILEHSDRNIISPG